MLPHSVLTLAEPPTDRPAASDPTTMRGFRSALRARLLSAVLIAVLAAGLPMLGGTAGLVLGLALGVVALAWGGPKFLRYLGWLRGIRRSARSSRWRQVRAGLVRGGPRAVSCVVVAEDGVARKLLRVHGIPWVGQLSIAYAGRMWVLGPDVAGRQAVALVGMRIPFRVSTIEELPPGEQPAEPAPGPNGTAIDEPVTAAAERLLVRRASFATAGAMIMVAWGTLVAMLGSPLLGWLWALGWLVQLGAAVRVSRFVPAISSGLSAGPWTALPTRLAPWPDSPRRRVSITGEVRHPDGRTFAIELPTVDENLVANVHAGGQLWFAGLPEPGRTSAVGVPGLPMLGAALVR